MSFSSNLTDRKMSILRASKLENIQYEEQAKFVNERLAFNEESLSKILSAFSFYNKKISSLRNATDDLAVVLYDYASEEKVNQSLKFHLLKFSESLASLGNCRDVEVKQLDLHITKGLSHYQTLCQNAKVEVKSILNLKDKEMNKRKQLEKLRKKNPYSRRKIIKAEAALSDAVSIVSSSIKELEEHMSQFEKKKIEDLKALLLKFITIEMTQHSNAIEVLTKSFKEINQIDILKDLQDFEVVMKNNIRDNSLEGTSIKLIKELNSTLNLSRNNTINCNTEDPNKEEQEQIHQESSESETDFSTNSDSYSLTGKEQSITSGNK